ncbi:MAG: ATP-binding cassette domain-containing protein [Enterocloster sp.]
MNNTQIRNTLASFLFTGDDVFKLIRDLSGGERGRVSLAKLMLSDANFLLLDEPTNHLDITSKEILESALNRYTGTVLYVSHDRYFINRTATRILDLTGTVPDQLYRQLRLLSGEKGCWWKQRLQPGKPSGQTAPREPRCRIARSRGFPDGQSWTGRPQKEEQARIRKRQNDLKKTEDAIQPAGDQGQRD